MRTRGTVILVTFVVVALLAGAQLRAQRSGSLREVMNLKLDYSHEILDAVVMDDFVAVQDYARQLAALSQEADWHVFPSADYASHSEEFKRAAEALTRAPESADPEAVVVAYMNLTQKCVQCHRYVRRAQNARQSHEGSTGRTGPHPTK